MTHPIKIRYSGPNTMTSGMIVEEVPVVPGTPAHSWPFKTSRFTVPPGAVSEPDEHEVAEMWLVRTGTGTVRSGTVELEVGPGDLVFFPSLVPHQVTAGDEPLNVFSVWWPGETR